MELKNKILIIVGLLTIFVFILKLLSIYCNYKVNIFCRNNEFKK